VNVEELVPVLERIRAEASAAAPAVANAMALAYQRHLVDSTLTRYSHPLRTKTPAPPGGPVALVTGTLRRSVRPDLASGGGPVATASVAPHTVYARLQELGGHIYPVRARYLRWIEDGVTHFSKHVYIPGRPYMKIATEETLADGSLRRAAVAAFEAAVHV
jgi:hypothetical protein